MNAIAKNSNLRAQAIAERAEQIRQNNAATQRLFLRQIKNLFGTALKPSHRIIFDVSDHTAIVDGILLRQKRVPSANDGYPDIHILMYVAECTACAKKIESLPLRSLNDLKYYLTINPTCSACRLATITPKCQSN